MRVLIVGQPKSGTTALMSAITEALAAGGQRVAQLFEPNDLEACDLEQRPLVAKKLMVALEPKEHATFYAFDKRLLILRDPRDRLLSVLLYDIYGRPEAEGAAGERWVDALARKEADPTSVGIIDLVYEYWELTGVNLLGWFSRTLDREIRFHNTQGRRRFHIVRYEDFVDGQVGDLVDHLGFAIDPRPEVDGEEARVARSKGSGDWRNWMLPSDLKVIRPMMEKPMNRLGFTDVSWQIARDPTLDPALGSRYVAGLVERRRRESKPNRRRMKARQ